MANTVERNILERYGIKEVADVTFYDIVDKNGIPTMGAPVLYLDTLKVSTIETTAENVSARGGKGNPELITWDYGKEITVTLEDALFSAKSMAIMFGSMNSTNGKVEVGTDASIFRTVPAAQIKNGKVTINNTEITIPAISTTESAGAMYYDQEGNPVTSPTVDSEGVANYAYVTFPMAVDANKTKVINVSSATFPGTYYITGDTYARREVDGKDEFFQFIIPKAKVTSEVTLTMEAEGDPSTFSMNLKVLRPADGQMMKLVQYSLPAKANG